MLNLNDPTLLRQAALVDGEWMSAGLPALEVTNPATGDVIGTVPDCGATETEAAIAAAQASWPDWRRRTAGERAALLEAWHALVLANLDDLARIMTAEQGKTLAEAQGEIRYAATFIKWFAEEGRRVGGRNVPSPERDRRIIVLTEPVGVSAAITQWNFPAAMITRKCAPALAAGCPVVIKPSEMTPFTALALANDTPYGLASYFYTSGLDRAFRVAEALEAGMIALNTGSIAMEMAPFGGVKQSGLGREGGSLGIEEYLETKAYHIDILTAQFVLNPDRFDVVVGSNLFGDILSDLGPACTGTIGVAPSGNINPEGIHPSLFEPVHGSAPDIAGQGIANPVGQIWSAAMMLEHLGEAEAAAAIMRAVEHVLRARAT